MSDLVTNPTPSEISPMEDTEIETSQQDFHLDGDVVETLIHASPLPLVVLDANGLVRLWNPAAERVFGWQVGEVLGQPLRVMPPERIKECEEIQKYVLRGNHYSATEDKRIRKDGSFLHVSVSASPLIIEGNVAGIIVIYDDITERKAAEARLAAEHAMTRILAEENNLSDAAPKILKTLCGSLGAAIGDLWLLDTQENVLQCVGPAECINDSAAEVREFSRKNRRRKFMNGYSLPGRVWACRTPIWIPHIEADENFFRKEEAEKAGLRSAAAFPIQTRDEFFGVIEFFMHHQHEPDDAMLQMMTAVGSEIGQFIQRKRAEEALKQSESRLRTLMDNMPAVIYMMDLENRYMLINDQIQKLRGNFTKGNIIGKSVYEVVAKEFADVFVANNNKVLEEKKQLEFEEIAPLHDGLHTFLSIKAPLVSNGKPYGICGVSTDITERKRVSQELARQTRELARSNAELEQFGHVVSHDLRAPLLSIDGCAQLLDAEYGDKLDDSARELIHHIRNEIHSMGQLIKGLLTYSRAGAAPPKVTIIQPENVLSQVLQSLKTAIDVNEAVITHDPLPEVSMDESQLMQLFQNLIENSIKYRGPQNPRIHIHAEDTGEDIHFSIIDNGIGIAPENLERVFGIFERLHSDARRDEGSGVGLAICKKIVERYGRRIWVESQPNVGSTFHFYLPKPARRPERV